MALTRGGRGADASKGPSILSPGDFVANGFFTQPPHLAANRLVRAIRRKS